jgi:hypothetical protein
MTAVSLSEVDDPTQLLGGRPSGLERQDSGTVVGDVSWQQFDCCRAAGIVDVARDPPQLPDWIELGSCRARLPLSGA